VFQQHRQQFCIVSCVQYTRTTVSVSQSDV